MFTDGIKGDILLNHHIVSFHRKLLFQMHGRVFVQAAVNLLTHAGNPVRRLQKSFPAHVLADSLQQKLNAGFDLFIIHHKKTHLLDCAAEHMQNICRTYDEISLHNMRCVLILYCCNGCGLHIVRLSFSFRRQLPIR